MIQKFPMPNVKYPMSNIKWFLCLLFLLLTVPLTLYAIPYTSAQSPSPEKISKTQKRLNRIEEYYKKSAMFREFKDESHRSAAEKYYEMTKKALDEGKLCRAEEGDDETKKKACDRLITASYMEAREFYRLLKWYQIEEAKPFVCVRAELGVGKELEARGISKPDIYANYLATGKPDPENPKETGRTERNQVFLCTGENGQRKLRVQTDSGKYVKLTPDDLARPELQIPNLPPKDSIEILEKQFGLSS